MAIFNPLKVVNVDPKCLRIVKASRSAWVGCSWVPSPALITDDSIQPDSANRFAAPDAG